MRIAESRLVLRVVSTASIAFGSSMLVACREAPRELPPPSASTSPGAMGATGPTGATTPPTSIDEGALGRGRDPFERPAILVTTPPPPGDTLDRKAHRYALDDLQLVAVIGGGDARAMLRDPRGVGWVVELGDHVGRSESAMNGLTGWRVDRIRDAEVVLSRRDLVHPDRPAETRTLALRDDREAKLRFVED